MDKGGENTTLELSGTLVDSRFLDFVRKKAEKVTTAVYFVTDLMSDREPLKWSIRDRAVALLGELLVHTSRSDSARVRTRIAEIASLLSVARASKTISEMNSNLLEDAYRELATLLGEAEGKTLLDPRVLEMSDRGSQKDMQKDTSYATSTPEELYDMSFRKTHRADLTKTTSQTKKEKKTQTAMQGEAEDRRKRLIALLKAQDKVTMNDIREEIQGVSKKTLQRDLTNLAKEDVIKKQGTKRWTTYSLVT